MVATKKKGKGRRTKKRVPQAPQVQVVGEHPLDPEMNFIETSTPRRVKLKTFAPPIRDEQEPAAEELLTTEENSDD